MAIACLNEIGNDFPELEDLKSDLHPTNTMGVEGYAVVKTGTQCLAVLNNDDLEDIEKQRRKASACSFVCPLLSPLPPTVPCVTLSSLSLVSHILYLVLSPLTITIFSSTAQGGGEHSWSPLVPITRYS